MVTKKMSLGHYTTVFEELPLSARRGLDFPDLSTRIIAVQSDIQIVSDCISQLYSPSQLCLDVYGKPIEISGKGVLVYQLESHPWTIVQEAGFQPFEEWFQLEHSQAQRVSEALNSRACFIVWTGCYSFYILFQQGKDVEGFYLESEMSEVGQPHKGVLVEKFPNLMYIEEFEMYCDFYSDWRKEKLKLAINRVRSPWEFTNICLNEIELYIPMISWDATEVGQSRVLELEGLSRSDVRRMDYLCFAS